MQCEEIIMASVNVENIDELVQLFEQKMGFPADSAGLEMTEEQLAGKVDYDEFENLLGMSMAKLKEIDKLQYELNLLDSLGVITSLRKLKNNN